MKIIVGIIRHWRIVVKGMADYFTMPGNHLAAMQIDWSSEGGIGHRLTRRNSTPRISSRILVPSVQGHHPPRKNEDMIPHLTCTDD